MYIKILNNEDVTHWQILRLESLKNSPEAFGSSYEEEIKYTNEDWQKMLVVNEIFGAFIDDKLVGTAGFNQLNIIKAKHRGSLFAMYIQEEYRGRGIANSLITTLLSYAKNHVRQIHLKCVTTNLAAVKFYQKYGFETYGVEPSALKVGNQFYDTYLMVLRFT